MRMNPTHLVPPGGNCPRPGARRPPRGETVHTDQQQPRPARDAYYQYAQQLKDRRGANFSELARQISTEWESVDRATVRAAITGLKGGRPLPLPREDTVKRLDEALGAEGTLLARWQAAVLEATTLRLGMAAPATPAEGSRHLLPDPAGPTGEDTTNRRVFSALTALAALAAATRQRIADGGVPERTLDELESDVDEIAQVYGSSPPADLLPEVTERWQQVEKILEGRMSADMRSRVTLLAGQLGYFLGRLAFNVQDLRAARQFAGLAGIYAEETGEPVLLMSVAALHSSIAYHTSRYHQALAALRSIGHLRHPYMDARIAAYRARTFAQLGDADAARAALNEMEATASVYTPIPGETPVGPAAVAMFRAGIAVILGDSAAAREWAPIAVDGYRRRGGDFTVEESQHAEATLALTYLLGRDAEPEEAARIARRILASDPSHTVMTKLRQCAGAFTPAHRGIPEVAEFVNECRALPVRESLR